MENTTITTTTTTDNNVNENKISVMDYLDNHMLLRINYTPFDTKMEIVGHMLTSMAKALGGINTTFLRRLSTETFIEAITNIDMNIPDENGLKGFDQLCYHSELNNLIHIIGSEYDEFSKILEERLSDYIRVETNPAVTINAIYDQVKDYYNNVLNFLSEYIQNIDVEKLSKIMQPVISKVGETNEG